MSISFVSGNLFTYDGLEAICHGCNCKGLMGAGIAKEIKEKFPKMHRYYQDMCAEGEFILGSVFMAHKFDTSAPYVEEIQQSGFSTIYNLATQNHPGPYASLKAIKDSVTTMIDDAEQSGIKTIGVPRLGAGIGGLDWNNVKRLLEELGNATPVELIVFEEFVK